MRRLTPNDVRDKYPGAVEEWVSDVLTRRQQEYADEREVLNHTVFWEDEGTLVLGWRIDGRSNHHLTRWNTKKLEWGSDVETVEFMQSHVITG